MTEFQELIKDAPKFASMERGELVAHAYAIYAAAAKTDAENTKLREIVSDIWVRIVVEYPHGGFPDMGLLEGQLRELGIEVGG